jgi:hypothetical protein
MDLCFLQRKKFVDEAKTLSEEISKLNDLLSSKKLIFQVRHFQPCTNISTHSVCMFSYCIFTIHVKLFKLVCIYHIIF